MGRIHPQSPAASGPPKAKDGRVEKPKNARPLSLKEQNANKKARMALATGEISAKEIEIKKQRDLRTLYIRFKDANNQPCTEEEIRVICPSAKLIRINRQAKRQKKNTIRYCFMEFDDEARCEMAKKEMESSSSANVFVDFVGEKSRNVQFTSKDVQKKKRPINPLKLCVSGLPKGITDEMLKKIFPRCRSAIIKKRATPIGFVLFRNAGEAKSAFDATQKLVGSAVPAGVPRLTVVYARLSKQSPSGIKKRDLKQKLKEQAEATDEKKTKKKHKKNKDDDDDEEMNDSVENDESIDDEMKVENDEESNDEDDDDDDAVDDDDEDDGEEVENDEESDDEDGDVKDGAANVNEEEWLVLSKMSNKKKK